MAKGSFKKYIRTDKEYLLVEWSSTANTSSNNSKVTATVYLYKPYSISSTAKKTVKLWINGSLYSGSVNGYNGKGKQKLFTKTVTITHNSDGKKSINIKAYAQLGLTLSGKYYEDVTTSNVSCKLDNIARTSTISMTNTSATLGNSLTVKLNRGSSTFRHKISCKVGTYTYTVLAKSSDNGSATSYSVSFPTSLIAYMSSKSATAKITCDTYASSSSSTLIGSKSLNCTISVPSATKPSVTAGNISVGVEPIAPNTNSTQAIVGKSKLKLTVNATTVDSSDYSKIANYQIFINDKEIYNGKSNTFTTPVFYDYDKNNQAVIKVVVKDARGLVSNATSKTITALPYSSVQITSLSANRCTSNGTLSETGTYVKVIVNFNYSATDGSNGIKCVIGSKKSTDTNYTTVDTVNNLKTNSYTKILSSYALATSYRIKVDLNDNYGSTASQNVSVGTEDMLLDIAQNGLAIGKAAEVAGVEFNIDKMPIYIYSSAHGRETLEAYIKRVK